MTKEFDCRMDALFALEGLGKFEMGGRAALEMLRDDLGRFRDRFTGLAHGAIPPNVIHWGDADRAIEQEIEAIKIALRDKAGVEQVRIMREGVASIKEALMDEVLKGYLKCACGQSE